MEFRDDRIYTRRSQPSHGVNGRWQPGGEFEHDLAPSTSDYGSDYNLEAGYPSEKEFALHVREEFHNSGDGIVEAVKNFFGLGPRNYLRSDARILEEVSEIFLHDRFLDASGIEVTAFEGAVILEGLVPDRESKWRAEDLTDSIAGIKEVRNLLRVRKEEFSEADFPHSEEGIFGRSGLRKEPEPEELNSSLPYSHL